VRGEDLAPFAVADGLLARIAAERPGKLTDLEHRHLLDVARENLARGTGKTLEAAGRAMFKAAAEGEFTLQCGQQFATVTMHGRILVVYTRVELAGQMPPGTELAAWDRLSFPLSLSSSLEWDRAEPGRPAARAAHRGPGRG
jgi:hypothetical protein